MNFVCRIIDRHIYSDAAEVTWELERPFAEPILTSTGSPRQPWGLIFVPISPISLGGCHLSLYVSPPFSLRGWNWMQVFLPSPSRRRAHTFKCVNSFAPSHISVCASVIASSPLSNSQPSCEGIINSFLSKPVPAAAVLST